MEDDRAQSSNGVIDLVREEREGDVEFGIKRRKNRLEVLPCDPSDREILHDEEEIVIGSKVLRE